MKAKAIGIIAALALMALAAVGMVSAQADTCAPEHREIPGNIASPCLTDMGMDKVETIRLAVVENAESDTCETLLVFEPWTPPSGFAESNARFNANNTGAAGRHKTVFPVRVTQGGLAAVLTSHGVSSSFKPLWDDFEPGRKYTSSMSFDHGASMNGYLSPDHPASHDRTGAVLLNKISGRGAEQAASMGACLLSLKNRLDLEAAQEQERQEAARAAIVKASQEAQVLEQQELLEQAKRNELQKTQNLIAELERQKPIIELVQQITRVKMAGIEARAEIMNTHLLGKIDN